MTPKTKIGTWTDEALKVTMDVIERGTHSLKKVSKSWNIPMSSITNHLNGKTKFKNMGPRGVLIKKIRCCSDEMDLRHVKMWTTLQQLKMKVANLIQIRDTPFRNGILCNIWWD
jgi:hypothetical protein